MNSHGPASAPRGFLGGPDALLTLAAWVVAVVAMGAGMSLSFGPDAWFDGLLMPFWNPPQWLFVPVGIALYVLMAVSIWLVRKQGDASGGEKRTATQLFLLQLLLNLAWTPLFFGLHRPLLAFVEICILWFCVLWTAMEFGKIRPLAGYLFTLYLLLVTFALVLSGTIGLINA